MLRYEVNKNAAISPKTNSSHFQFQSLENKEVKSLFIVGLESQSISEGLSKFSYDFQSFENMEQAIGSLLNKLTDLVEMPDAIICDLELNDGDAYSLFEKVQRDKYLSTLPFIIVARNASDEEKSKAMEQGVDDFYCAPIDVDDLHHRITFLKQFRNEKNKLNPSEDDLFENKVTLLKRSFDIILSLVALLILSPLLAVVAILIKLESKGPVFYISKRVGTGYHIFDLYKFRSMKPGADVELKNLAHLNQYSKDGNGTDPSFFKLDNDPRVTGFGRFLRSSSIDEIPQLLNVLKGDMSLVGNRPLPLYEAEQLTKDVWSKRFLAPAGLTGLWQVSRRGQEEMSVGERVVLDNTYADRYSFWLDLKIILKTFPALISKIQS